MSGPFDPMDIFNGKKFTECYGWGKVDILKFLKDVANNPETYGIKTAQSKLDVKLLEEKIAGLTDLADPPGTSIYFFPVPKQQVLRKADATGTLSLDPTRSIPWDANDKKESFYIIFDLLGCFLSLITSVPSAGTDPIAMAKKYFLPVLVLYAKWCFELKVSNKNIPNVVQVTWFETKSKLWPLFGASIAGYAKPKDEAAAKAWENVVQNTRWNYLYAGSMLPTGYTKPDDSPLRRNPKDGTVGTKYGNCGETYPLLYIVRDPLLLKSTYGIAAPIGGLFPKKDKDPRYKTYNGKACWDDARAMWPPCDNCKSLLTKVDPKVNLKNFELFKP